MKTFYINKRRFIRFLTSFLLLGLHCFTANAQNCPPNIDFETGTFQGWTCYTGTTADINGENVITIYPSGPVSNRHTMYSYTANSQDVDPYGGFPVVCPNGSGYSIRLEIIQQALKPRVYHTNLQFLLTRTFILSFTITQSFSRTPTIYRNNSQEWKQKLWMLPIIKLSAALHLLLFRMEQSYLAFSNLQIRRVTHLFGARIGQLCQ